jgi:hypothetical protein
MKRMSESKSLTIHDVEIEIAATRDETPVRGNASDLDDPAEARAEENEILKRIDNGEVWAWAVVTVTVRDPVSGLSAGIALEEASYRDEQEFRDDRNFYRMALYALTEINKQFKKSA